MIAMRRSPHARGWPLMWLLAALACTPDAAPSSRVQGVAEAGVEPEAQTDHLIRYACQGFDIAVAADAPRDRLLSTTALHATELGGEPVELATRRWALTPPQGLLEEIDAYEHSGAAPRECAGLRSHLERLAQISASH